MSGCFHVNRRNRSARPLQEKKTWRELTRERDTQTGQDADEASDDERGAAWRLDSYDVADLLGKWALFYEAQQTGVISADNRVPWRGDSYLADGLFAAGRWNPDFDLTGGAQFTFALPACLRLPPRSCSAATC